MVSLGCEFMSINSKTKTPVFFLLSLKGHFERIWFKREFYWRSEGTQEISGNLEIQWPTSINESEVGLPAREKIPQFFSLGAPEPEETCIQNCPTPNSLTVDPALERAINRGCWEKRRNEKQHQRVKETSHPYLPHCRLYKGKHFNSQ